jgi:hypothetical protein
MAEMPSYERRVLERDAVLATLAAERDPQNFEKRLNAEAAQERLFAAGNTVAGAITKALLAGNQQHITSVEKVKPLLFRGIPEEMERLRGEEAENDAIEKAAADTDARTSFQDAIAQALGKKDS